MTPSAGPDLVHPVVLAVLAAMTLAGVVATAWGARAVGARRVAWVALGSALITAALVELGARVAVRQGLAGPSHDRRGGDMYADDVRIEGLPPVPRHLLPAPGRRPEPRPDVARILVLGDSFAHGEGVRPSETFAARLEQLVHPADGRPVQVVNLSMSSLDLRAEHALFLGYGQAFAPDVVVWVVVPNDLGGGAPEDPSSGMTDLVVHRDPPVEGTSLALALAVRAVRIRRLEAAVERSYRSSFSDGALEGAETMFGDVVDAVQARGGRVLVVVFPLLWRLDEQPFKDLHDLLLSKAGIAGAETFDLGSVMQGLDASELWATPHDHHPNSLAHARVAQALASVIGTDVPRTAGTVCLARGDSAVAALCNDPSARVALSAARTVGARDANGGLSLHLLAGPFLALAWTEAESLPPAERDALRAEVLALARSR